MPFGVGPLVVSEEERQELQQMTQSRTLPAGDVMRSRMILLLAGGVAYKKIQALLDTTAPTISRWKRRFLQQRIAGLMEELHPGQQPSVRTPKLQAKVLAAIQEGPKDGSTHWSCRKLASKLRVSKDTIQRILAQADIRPHRLERYMASDDPDFETKAADVIGLYLAPPQHAAVFCVDEKTAIQALDRLDPVLPLSPGRLERHGFEYKRNGTLSLYAALDVKTGKVQGRTAERHTSAQFVDVLEQVVSGCKPYQEIHIILDNLSAHNDHSSRRVPESKYQREASFHAHLLFLAESSRNLVCTTGARSYRSWHLHFDPGSVAQTPALHPRLLQDRAPL
jgi:transposase